MERFSPPVEAPMDRLYGVMDLTWNRKLSTRPRGHKVAPS